MSDLHMCELEDIAWDEFDQISDRLVPHPSNEHGNELAYQEDNCKKHRHEVIGVSSDRCSSRETTVLSHSIRVPGQHLNSSDIDTLDVEFRDNDAKAGERCAVNDTNSSAYDPSFLDNDRENNESEYLLYNVWPDIENFEDVHTMLRSCDSTFGFERSNQNDMAWLSSDIESNFVPFENVPQQDLSKLNNASSDSNVGSVVFDRKGEFVTKDQQGAQFDTAINFHNSTANHLTDGHGQRKKQVTHPNISKGKKKNHGEFRQVTAHPDNQKQKKNVSSNSFGYLQTPSPYMNSNYVYPPNQLSIDSQLTGLELEMNSLASADEKLEKLRTRQSFYHYSVSKQFHQSQNELENHSGVERNNVTNPVDGDSSSVPETSCMSSGFEASSFCQLQQVVKQLDTRTKSCIRDSLYRLARSAELKHKYANMKGGGQRDREAGDAFMADRSNNGLMDMETDTNPIDRSVAHLLFHRPSDSSAMPVHVGSSLKSHTMINGSITSPTILPGELVCKEETASDIKNKVPINSDG